MADKLKINDKDAIIVVDVQNCFLPGGALGVEEGDEIIPVLNKLIPKFETKVFTRDWHPSDHCSFSDDPEFKDKSWPPHCVRNTEGAEFGPDLKVPDDAIIISKADDPEKEAYSGFQDTELTDKLKERGVERVFIGGLATDFCVKFTTLHAIERGFETIVVRDAAKGIDNPEGSVQEALKEMEDAGAKVVTSDRIEA